MYAAALAGDEVTFAALVAKAGAKAGTFASKVDTKTGSSPLHAACLLGLSETVSLIIAAGADLMQEDAEHRFPLHCAVKSGDLATVKMLTDAHDERRKGTTQQLLQRPDKQGMTPVHLAVLHVEAAGGGAGGGGGVRVFHVGLAVEAQFGGKDVFYAGEVVLVNDNGTLNIQYADGDQEMNVSRDMVRTMEESGAAGGTLELVLSLAKDGLDKQVFQYHTSNKATGLLHLAVQKDGGRGLGSGTTRAVLRATEGDQKTWVDMQDGDGRTPLHHACVDGNQEVAEVLLAAKADPRLVDCDGQNPMHWAYVEEEERREKAGKREREREERMMNRCMNLEF